MKLHHTTELTPTPPPTTPPPDPLGLLSMIVQSATSLRDLLDQRDTAPANRDAAIAAFSVEADIMRVTLLRNRDAAPRTPTTLEDRVLTQFFQEALYDISQRADTAAAYRAHAATRAQLGFAKALAAARNRANKTAPLVVPAPGASRVRDIMRDLGKFSDDSDIALALAQSRVTPSGAFVVPPPGSPDRDAAQRASIAMREQQEKEETERAVERERIARLKQEAASAERELAEDDAAFERSVVQARQAARAAAATPPEEKE